MIRFDPSVAALEYVADQDYAERCEGARWLELLTMMSVGQVRADVTYWLRRLGVDDSRLLIRRRGRSRP